MRRKCVTDPAYEEVNNAFERALVFMHKVRWRRRRRGGERAVDISVQWSL